MFDAVTRKENTQQKQANSDFFEELLFIVYLPSHTNPRQRRHR
jgi:hypothetical protein